MTNILTTLEDRVFTITLNRPEKLNAFAGTMREELLAALEQGGNDSAARVIVITGAGRAFCAGGDVEYMSGLQKQRAEDDFLKLLVAGKRIALAMTGFSML
jgi:enoyl-CoA hydratase/carnithine racemase